ncbi:hypothetical protein FIBSPDRAFT_1015316 [Athelia psychrophila]|uniref:Uncharacterized protein n=1 Tax=Athelia psychrophila TaxID=1759441 RepID=A0A166LU47_9AGAM|nr:hypothetical protein FIBSPDRAFT_1015316 [Fibularhizoctonia sp. CBS 109695]
MYARRWKDLKVRKSAQCMRKCENPWENQGRQSRCKDLNIVEQSIHPTGMFKGGVLKKRPKHAGRWREWIECATALRILPAWFVDCVDEEIRIRKEEASFEQNRPVKHRGNNPLHRSLTRALVVVAAGLGLVWRRIGFGTCGGDQGGGLGGTSWLKIASLPPIFECQRIMCINLNSNTPQTIVSSYSTKVKGVSAALSVKPTHPATPRGNSAGPAQATRSKSISGILTSRRRRARVLEQLQGDKGDIRGRVEPREGHTQDRRDASVLTEIRNAFIAHPEKLVLDAVIAGASLTRRTRGCRARRLRWVPPGRRSLRGGGGGESTRCVDQDGAGLIPKSLTGKMLKWVLQDKLHYLYLTTKEWRLNDQFLENMRMLGKVLMSVERELVVGELLKECTRTFDTAKLWVDGHRIEDLRYLATGKGKPPSSCTAAHN